MGGGLLPVGVAAATVVGVLVWTMAAHDPYWRLFETESVPAPAYESAEEIQAALATARVVAPPPDSVAVRPDTGASRVTEPPTPAIALLPRSVEPLVAVPFALDPGGAFVVAPTPEGEPAQPGAEDSVAAHAAPRLPSIGVVAAGEPLPGTTLAAIKSPAPVAVPEAPGPLWIAADEGSEQALALARAQRRDVQRRLALAGFDPRGFDGVFGPRTREAIADFQEAWGFPSTGYLDAAAYAELRARTEEAYTALASRAAAEPRAAPKIAPLARERQLAAVEPSGCDRDGDGRIIARQNLGCDLKGFAEKVVSLGRNKLPHEEGTVFGRTPGTDR